MGAGKTPGCFANFELRLHTASMGRAVCLWVSFKTCTVIRCDKRLPLQISHVVLHFLALPDDSKNLAVTYWMDRATLAAVP